MTHENASSNEPIPFVEKSVVSESNNVILRTTALLIGTFVVLNVYTADSASACIHGSITLAFTVNVEFG